MNFRERIMNLQSLLKLLGLGSNPQRLQEAQLRAMSDRELVDLGIGRGQIPAVLSDEAWIAGQARNDKCAGQAPREKAVIPELIRDPCLAR